MFAAFLCFVLASENWPIWVSNHRDKTESSLTFTAILLPAYWAGEQTLGVKDTKVARTWKTKDQQK